MGKCKDYYAHDILVKRDTKEFFLLSSRGIVTCARGTCSARPIFMWVQSNNPEDV
jgi:hypothetical protein